MRKKTNKYLISMVCVTYNSTENLKTTIKSILEQKIPFENTEIIIVDNGSDLREVNNLVTFLESIRKNFGNLIFLPLKMNIGAGGGFNLGISLANGNFIFKIDSDVLIPPGTLSKMINYATKFKTCILGVPEYSLSDGKLFTPGTNFINPLFMERKVKFSPSKSFLEVDLVPGPLMLVTKTTISTIGNIDPSFFIYYDDYDFCYRAKKHKIIVGIIPQLKFYHIGKCGSIITMNSERLEILTMNRIRFLRKHLDDLHLILPFIYLFFATIKKIFVLLLHRKYKPIKFLLKGSIKGWITPISV